MEFHGKSWKVEGIYNHYLVTNQASNFLASDFCVLVCFVCLVFFRFTNRLVFWRIVLLSISYPRHSISQQVFWFACSSPPTFETKSRRNFGYIFPRTIRRPLDQELDQAA